MTKVIAIVFTLSLNFAARADEVKTVEVAAATAAPAVAEVTKPADIKLAEDQIPLRIEANQKTAEDSAKSSTRVLLSGFILVVLLGAAYYLVRRYRVSNKINPSNMQIKILTQHYLGPKKSLAIIRVSGESILIGITDTNISMIKSLSLIDDEVPADVPQKFSDTLQADEKRAAGAKAAFDELDEEFSFSGVRDTVSKKLKSMRSFS